MFSRFKAIGMVRNYDEAGLPAVIGAYNGKPVLIRERGGEKKRGSGELVGSADGRALEMSVDVGAWGFLARTGFAILAEKLPQVGRGRGGGGWL